MNRNLESLRKSSLLRSKISQDKEEKIALKLRDISDEDLRKEIRWKSPSWGFKVKGGILDAIFWRRKDSHLNKD